MSQNKAVNENAQISQSNEQDDTNDKDLFEDEITQSNRDVNNYSSPLLMIDK